MLNLSNIKNISNIGSGDKGAEPTPPPPICISTYEPAPAIAGLTSGVLSDGNKTVTFLPAVGNYGNVLGKEINPTDSTTYTYEFDVVAPVGGGVGDLVRVGMIDLATGDFAGFQANFGVGQFQLIDFGGAVLDSVPLMGPSFYFGMTYQASTNTIEVYLDLGGVNPSPRFTINTLSSTLNNVRGAISIINVSGTLGLTFPINTGASEYNMLYPNGVTTSCGTPFCDLGLTAHTALGNEYLMTNNKRTFTTDGISGVQNAGRINSGIANNDNNLRIVEVVLSTVTNPADILQFVLGLLNDSITNTPGALAFDASGDIQYVSIDGVSAPIFETLLSGYVPTVGDTFGIATNRTTAESSIYLNTTSGGIQTFDRIGYPDITTTLDNICIFFLNDVASTVGVTTNYLASQMVGTYPITAVDYCGNPIIIPVCSPTFDIIAGYTSGVLSNLNTQTVLSGPIGNLGNSAGGLISPSDSNNRIHEIAIVAGAIAAGDNPLMGVVDTITGEFAGLRFLTNTTEAQLVDFGGAILETIPGIGAPASIGMTYQASTNTFKIYGKETIGDSINPESIFTTTTLSAPANDVQFINGLENNSGPATFTFQINNGPTEYEIIYEDGATTICGTDFCDLGVLSFSAAIPPFLVSNNKLTYTMDSSALIAQGGGIINATIPLLDDIYRIEEFELSAVTDPTQIQYQVATANDTFTNVIGALNIAAVIGIFFSSQDGVNPPIQMFLHTGAFTPSVGDTYGIATNRTTGISIVYAKIGDVYYNYIIQGYPNTTDPLLSITALASDLVTNVTSTDSHLDAIDIEGVYINGAIDYCGIEGGNCGNFFTSNNGGTGEAWTKDATRLIGQASNTTGLVATFSDLQSGFIVTSDVIMRVIEYNIDAVTAYDEINVSFQDATQVNTYGVRITSAGNVDIIKNDGVETVVNVATGKTLIAGSTIGLGFNVITGEVYVWLKHSTGDDVYNHIFGVAAAQSYASIISVTLQDLQSLDVTVRNGANIAGIYPVGTLDTCGNELICGNYFTGTSPVFTPFDIDATQLIGTATNISGGPIQFVDLSTGKIADGDSDFRMIEYEFTSTTGAIPRVQFGVINDVFTKVYQVRIGQNTPGELDLYQNTGGPDTTIVKDTGITLGAGDVLGFAVKISTGEVYVYLKQGAIITSYAHTFVPIVGENWTTLSSLTNIDPTVTVMTAHDFSNYIGNYPVGTLDTCGNLV